MNPRVSTQVRYSLSNVSRTVTVLIFEDIYPEYETVTCRKVGRRISQLGAGNVSLKDLKEYTGVAEKVHYLQDEIKFLSKNLWDIFFKKQIHKSLKL